MACGQMYPGVALCDKRRRGARRRRLTTCVLVRVGGGLWKSPPGMSAMLASIVSTSLWRGRPGEQPMSRRTVYVRIDSGPRVPGFAEWVAVFFLIGLVVWLWKWILPAVTVVVVARVLWVRHRDVLAERTRLAAQADKEHAAVLRGDPYGTYGRFAPYVATVGDDIGRGIPRRQG